MANNKLILGIDLGGTKSAACLADMGGNVCDRVAMTTPAERGGTAVVAALVDMARGLYDRACSAGATVLGVGVSAGAPADSRRGLVFDAPNLPTWGQPEGFGLPLAQILSDALDGLSVTLENDADATALAEHRFGAGRGVGNMAFLTVGTGIGAGLILNGAIHRGARGAGGEIGHIAVEPGGRLCLCGLRGCLEAYASGPSIVRIAGECGWRGDHTAPAVIAAARTSDGPARDAVEQAGRMLGRGLATLCMLLDLERIVLGTLAVHAGDVLLPIIDRTMRDSAWPRLTDLVTVVPAELGDRAQDLAAICAFSIRDSDALAR